jgi:hypothetical protein
MRSRRAGRTQKTITTRKSGQRRCRRRERRPTSQQCPSQMTYRRVLSKRQKRHSRKTKISRRPPPRSSQSSTRCSTRRPSTTPFWSFSRGRSTKLLGSKTTAHPYSVKGTRARAMSPTSCREMVSSHKRLVRISSRAGWLTHRCGRRRGVYWTTRASAARRSSRRYAKKSSNGWTCEISTTTASQS